MASDKKDKYSIDQVKKIPSQILLRMIGKMKKNLSKDPIMKKVFKEYKTDIKELEFIPMYFKDLDVSAKTDHCIIYFNYSLLCDGDFYKDYSYAIHEVTHFLQQSHEVTISSKDEDYLDNESEIEGFQNQLEFIDNEFGKDKAHDYVNDLLEHHEVSNKELKNKKEELLAKV